MMKPWLNRRTLFALLVIMVLSLNAGWQAWAERHREEVRDWRTALQLRLQEWFPEELLPTGNDYGFQNGEGKAAPQVVLLHGLDEPGGIWDDLLPALRAEGVTAWPFRYPNDQAIELSADFLAEEWRTLPRDTEVVLVGHSMGGLVIRDFVTRHHLGLADESGGPEIRGVILVGTPNHGSEWARFRIWLEVREQFARMQRGEFTLLGALREGTGAANIDLRPESAFLEKLNARPWPQSVPLRIIGGLIAEPTDIMNTSLGFLERELGEDALTVADGLRDWWGGIGDALGDGVVPVESLVLQDAPAPLLLSATHRGLLARRDAGQPEPPAIRPILELLCEWGVVAD
ncbi:MAG TPA: alpha/beta hydrolase [Azoarcus taiwanensis]|nr:alpha/beta hydrolase [Azoarcus taiwanensis]